MHIHLKSVDLAVLLLDDVVTVDQNSLWIVEGIFVLSNV